MKKGFKAAPAILLGILLLCVLSPARADILREVDMSYTEPVWSFDDLAAAPALVYHDLLLEEGRDYTLSPGAGYWTVTGCGRFTGDRDLRPPVVCAAPDSSVLPTENAVYTGQPIVPAVGNGYTIQAWNNVAAGTAHMRVISDGAGGTVGAVYGTFQILPRESSSVRITDSTRNYSVRKGDVLSYFPNAPFDYRLSFRGNTISSGTHKSVYIESFPGIRFSTGSWSTGVYTLTVTPYTYSSVVQNVYDSVTGTTGMRYVHTPVSALPPVAFTVEVRAPSAVDETPLEGLVPQLPAAAGVRKTYLAFDAYPASAVVNMDEAAWTVLSANPEGGIAVGSLGEAVLYSSGEYRVQASCGGFTAIFDLSVDALDIGNGLMAADAGGETVIIYNGERLTEGIDYTLAREDTCAATQRVTASGIGLFQGTLEGFFHKNSGYPLCPDEDPYTDTEIPPEMNFEFSGTAVTNYVGSSACVVIPDGVTAVYSGAFKNCAMADRIESVVIPSTVVTVGSEAFMGCSALKTVRVVGSGLTQIMYSAFRDCAALEHIDLPSSLRTLGSHVFLNCTSLGKIVLPDSISAAITVSVLDSSLNVWARYGTQTASSFLGRDYFDTETGLRIRNTTQYDYDTGLYTLVSSGVISCSFDRDTVTVPEGIAAIEANALYSSLGKPSVVILPGGIESIGDSAICPEKTLFVFEDGTVTAETVKTSGLPYITSAFPDGAVTGRDNALCLVRYLGHDADIVIPEGVVSIAGNAFMGDQSIVTLSLPASLRSIGDSAFAECPALETVYFSEGLSDIGSWAFGGCASLKALWLPESVRTLGRNIAAPGMTMSTLPSEFTVVHPHKNAFFTLPDAASGTCDVFMVAPDSPMLGVFRSSGVYHILEGEEDFILRGRSVARCTAAGGEIYVPYGVTTLYYTFSGCGPDTVIHIPESVTAVEIDTVSFSRHFSLAYLPSGVASFKSFRKSDGCYVCPANSVTEQTLLDAGCTYRLEEYPDWLIDRVVLEDGTAVRRALSYLGEEEDVYLPEDVQYVSSSLIGRGGVVKHIHIGPDIRTDAANFTISQSWTALEEFRVPLGASSVTLGYGSISNLRYVEIPEGVTRLSGTLNSSADCVFVLPSTLTEISGNLTYGHVTFYCSRDSYADTYGREKGYTVLYPDNTALQRVLGPEILHGDINTCVDLGKVLTRIPASPAEAFDIVIDDPSVARVDGNRLTFLALGETTLHVKANAAAEDVLDITVQSWLPVEEFVIPTIYNMDGYRRVYSFRPVITKPETGGNPYFSWHLNGENLSSLPSFSASSKEFRVLGAADLTVTATSASGVTATGRLDFSSRAETIIIDCETDHHLLLGDLFSLPWDKITFVIDGDAKSAGQLIADGALDVGVNGEGVLRMLTADRCQAVMPGTAEIALKKMTLPPQSGSTPAQYEDLLTLTLTVSEGSALVIPEGIEQIDEEAFSGICVRRIILPDSLSAIGSRAFADCGDLRVIELSSLMELDPVSRDAFSGCSPFLVFRFRKTHPSTVQTRLMSWLQSQGYYCCFLD